MLPRNYYCLIAGLPDIVPDDTKISLTQADFYRELQEQLNPKDFELIELLFLPVDNKNLLNLLEKKKEPFLPLGKYSVEEFEEQIKEPGDILDYLEEFIIHYKNDTPVFPGLSWENQLTTLYYDYILTTKNEFLRNWFEFELNIKNIITGINCRKHDFDSEKQLIGINPIVESIKKSNAKDFGLSNEIPFKDKIFQLYEMENKFHEREKGIDSIKWEYLDENTFFHYFSIEKIISFVIKLSIVERWLTINKEAGIAMFNRLLKDMEKGYTLPEEFNV